MTVAVLFARRRTVYRSLGVDVYDIDRDARTYTGTEPVVAHPPCRAWGRLRTMAKPRPDEKALALFAVETVRRCGGVLEHPANSTLWPEAGLPEPGERDAWGGFTLPIYQSWWGHRAPKPSRLYIVGVKPAEVPAMPLSLDYPTGRVESMCAAERERTPPALAQWLLDLAEKARAQ